MYSVEFSKELERKLAKIQKKNKRQFEILLKKVREIKENPEHYKPLRYDLKNFKRVHVGKSFVLIYEIIGDKVVFLDIDHHDVIYRKKLR